jgi:single-strand DNA-binding protein
MSGETIITVIGNLTSDPELKYTAAGVAVVNLTIASTPKSFDKNTGQWVDGEALFMRSSVWRDYAEHVAATLTKGARVIAQGVLKQRSYETAAGEKRTAVELEIEAIGPDLRYATAVVTRTGAKAAAGAPSRPAIAPAGTWSSAEDFTFPNTDDTPF